MNGSWSSSRLMGWLCVLVVMGWTACSSRAAGESEPVVGAGSDVILGDAEARADGEEDHGTAARFNIPPEHLPPPGQCRIWEPGEPPDEQARKYPVDRCSTLRMSIPAGAWLVYRPTDGTKYVRVWLYGSEREVLQQRIYDIETGELVRHIAPASGN